VQKFIYGLAAGALFSLVLGLVDVALKPTHLHRVQLVRAAIRQPLLGHVLQHSAVILGQKWHRHTL
jgi:hypothetical protein